MSIQIRVAGLVLSAIVASAASAQTAVEWKVSEGGNGHWYQLVVSGPITWPTARSFSEQHGGYLATPRSQAEQAFLLSLSNRADHPTAWVNDFGGNAGGPWLGGFQPEGAPQAQPWAWVSGEPWDWTGWAPGEPNGGYSPGISVTGMLGYAGSNYYRGWSDAGLTDFPPYPLPPSFLVEWSADCNGDGIVDYGQITSGQLDDDNGDGIPDACQYSVTGVIPVSGASSGGTAITIKGANFPENPVVRVGGVLATDVVRVSATRITAVTPAGLPGMTSVTVGNWVQPNAFYFRPECGSDLDQNGTVDAADISIILLDFGPCYEPQVALPTPAPTPLLADEAVATPSKAKGQ